VLLSNNLVGHKVGVVAKNSTSYVKTLFEQYVLGNLVVLLRSDDDERISNFGVEEVITPENTWGWITEEIRLPSSDAAAQVSFTSGTEGEPKGVILSHRALDDVTQRLNEVMVVDPSIREYVGVPANYSFGLGRFRAVLSVGGQAFLPQNGFNPVEIKEMLGREEINAISAVPSLWRILLKNKSIYGNETLLLKWIEIGSQYMSRKEKEELKLLFPNAVIVQHYGLTEASRTTFLRIDKTDGEMLESVGQTYGETEIKISDNGKIVIRGPHVSKKLLISGNDKANVNEEGWFETNDLGELKGNYLFYKGRSDDQINCSGIKLSPEALERDIRERMEIKEGIAVGRIKNELTGDGILVAAQKGVDFSVSELQEQTEKVLEKYGIKNKSVVKSYILDEFPVTGTGKVQRSKLSSLVPLKQEHKLSEQKVAGEYTENQKKVIEIWQSILNREIVDIDQTFYEQGGDSLLVISALVEMERSGIPSNLAKGLVQGYTIREIANNIEQAVEMGNHQLKTIESKATMSINIVRGLLVLIVISAHWYHGIIERAFSTEAVSAFKLVFQPIFSMGTPGFAVIYGIGLGYTMNVIYRSDSQRVKAILSKTFQFIAIGIVALALVRVMANYEAVVDGTFHYESAFYSVLVYYLLATGTMYYWFKAISMFQNEVFGAYLLAIAMYVLHILCFEPLSMAESGGGLLEMIKLIFTAKFAYFLMLSGTLAGVAAGMQLSSYIKLGKSLSQLIIIGMAILLAGLAMTLHLDNYVFWTEPVQTNYIWRWFVYFGLVLILIGVMNKLLSNYNRLSSIPRYLAQFLATFGVLAFPLFVLHEMVIPIKAILFSFTQHDSLSILISFGLFIVLVLALFKKVFKVSYQ
jgi:acyl-CoA synthetase (AMP-forming)/AMP-acid ligase II